MEQATRLPEAADVDELHAFVLELGRALSLAGTAVSETQERLTVIAGASGAPNARIVVLPIALAIARLPGGPPSPVTFLPASWVLVPGALGLIGVTEVVGDPATAARRIS